MNQIPLTHKTNIKNILKNNYLIDISLDINNNIYFLTQIKKKPNESLQYKSDNVSDTYEIYHLKEDQVESILQVSKKDCDYDFLRISNDEILLVGARCTYHSEDKIDKNAVIIDYEGNIKREFTLGDGIGDIKIENNTRIWTSYFDEGIYGNNGWDRPIGYCGLRSWSLDGKEDYIYKASNYDYAIDDCYALNIDKSNNKWFYFYMEFYLGKISSEKIEYFSIDIDGGNTMAISENYILSDEGYGKRSTFSLLVEKNKKYQKEHTFNFSDKESSQALEIISSHAYGEHLLIAANRKIYMTSVSEIKALI
jgi:hypothetical protein